MPIRPAPTTYQCPMCHWTKTVAPASDALMPGEYFRACPECDCKALVRRPATVAEWVLGRHTSFPFQNQNFFNQPRKQPVQKPPQNQIDQEKILKEIKEKINQIRTYTPKVGVFGSSGVGKSSLCNALFGKEVAKISSVEACTREVQEIFIGDHNGGIKLIDFPGIGEDPQRQKEYTELYKNLLPELDLILWAIKSDGRNYASDLETYQKISQEKNLPPLIFVITQTDKIDETDDWDHESYQPDGTQIANIAIKENDISKRFNISTKNIISVAISKKGRSYNLKNLVEIIVDTLPNEKKYSLTREIKGENVSIQARTNAELGIWEAIKDFAGEALDTVKDKAKDLIIETIPELASKVKDVVLSSIGKLFRWF